MGALGLPHMGLALLAVGLSVYYIHSSVRSAREGDSTRLHRQRVINRANGPDVTKQVPAPVEVQEKTSSLSIESSEREPDEQRKISAAADSERAKHGNLQAPGQAPINTNGLFNNAHDLIFYQPVMNNINQAEEKVFQWLAKFTMSGAEFDASDHVPGCHPGTRITILETLQRWIDDTEHIHEIMWLHGPAGVGKSAILQSLAEQLSEGSKLGATLFFSRPNGHYNSTFVVPTIAYQLAVRIPPYKEHIKQIMVNDPKLLEKDVQRQFQALITEPFTRLRSITEGGRRVILLDGLDECQGENAQVLIVKLISRFTRQHPTVPLAWLIASRPEAHLQVVFNSEEVRGSLEEHEVLANSDDACRDVEKYLRAKFWEIRENYKDLIPIDVPWPAEQDITRISKTSSGLFALATTIVHYVEDPEACDPVSQLATVLSITDGLESGSLSTLYTLYSTILDGVPKALSPVLKLVLVFYTAVGRIWLITTEDTTGIDNYPLVLFATILGLQQHTVYGALRKLHSVIKVPPYSESGRLGIKFYHASFPDYLMKLEDYTTDIDTMRKIWWGFFVILHKGDSSAYGDAIAGGQPPISLSWDMKLADGVLEALWCNGICFLLYNSYRRPTPAGEFVSGQSRPYLNGKELQSAFEKIDFSALVFQNAHAAITLEVLFHLFKRLANAVPSGLLQSDVVKKLPMRDLDLACVLGTKYSYEIRWYLNENTRRQWNSPRIYNTTAPQHNRSGWVVLPTEELVLKLGELRSENPTMDVLVVGKGSPRRCVLICDPFAGAQSGMFYYVPYCG